MAFSSFIWILSASRQLPGISKNIRKEEQDEHVFLSGFMAHIEVFECGIRMQIQPLQIQPQGGCMSSKHIGEWEGQWGS